MTKFILLTVLVATTQVCLSQNKKTPVTVTKKTVVATTKQSEESLKALSIAPSREVPMAIVLKAKSLGANFSGDSQKIPTSSEKDFMYDDFVLYGEKGESYLVNTNGNIDIMPSGTRLITTTKNNARILADKGQRYSEAITYNNVRIIDKLGKKLDVNLSEYIFSINMQQNVYNSETNSYVLVYSKSGLQNIITENGTKFFPSDLANINFILPGYISYEEDGKLKLMELKTKRNIDISAYSSLYALKVNKLLVGISTGKYTLFNPATNKVLFESDKLINEVDLLSDTNPENYFVVGDNTNEVLVDDKGKRVFAEDYARYGFNYKNNRIWLEDKQNRENYYDLAKKAFVYSEFYTKMTTEGMWDVVTFSNYCQIYDNKTGAFLYGQNKNIKAFTAQGEYAVLKYGNYCDVYDGKTNSLLYGEKDKIKNFRLEGNMYALTKQIDPDHTRLDIYDKASNAVIFANAKKLLSIENTDKYFAVTKENDAEDKFSIIDRSGKILIQEVTIPNFIKYNIDKGTFALTKVLYGKSYECFDKTGQKVRCN